MKNKDTWQSEDWFAPKEQFDNNKCSEPDCKGTELLKKGMHPEAIKELTQAIEKNSRNELAYFNRGLAYEATQQYDNAINDFTTYLALAKNDAVAYYHRGICYKTTGACDGTNAKIYTENAINDFKKVLELKPQSILVVASHLKSGYCRISNLESQTKPSGNDQKDYSNYELVNAFGLTLVPSLTLKQVAGMRDMKEIVLMQMVYPLKHREKAEKYGKRFGGGFLLYGPPGCGKSYMAEAIAGELGMKMIRASVADILNMYIGNSEKNLGRIFNEARRNQPCIIVFDEIEAFGGRRDKMTKPWERGLVNQFLAEMDRIDKNKEQIVVIGTTNAPWDVDYALRRSGRFTHTIFIGPPDFDARLELLRLCKSNIKIIEEEYLSEVAMLTNGFSNSNIRMICEKARDWVWKEAVEKDTERKIEVGDLLKVIEREKSDVSEWFEIARGFSANAVFKESYPELFRYMEEKRDN